MKPNIARVFSNRNFNLEDLKKYELKGDRALVEILTAFCPEAKQSKNPNITIFYRYDYKEELPKCKSNAILIYQLGKDLPDLTAQYETTYKWTFHNTDGHTYSALYAVGRITSGSEDQQAEPVL